MKWLLVLLAACAADPHAGVAARRDDLVVTVEATGEITTIDRVDVPAPSIRELSSYSRIAWLAPEGSNVQAGDPLVTFDDGELDRTLTSARHDLAEAKQLVAKRREEIALERHAGELQVLEMESSATRAKMKTAVPKDLVSSIELRTQELDSELAQITLERAKQSVAFARESGEAELRDLDAASETAERAIAALEGSRAKLAIAAPRAGTVVYVRKVGESVYARDPAVQLVSLDHLVATGTIDEIDRAHVAVGAPVTVSIDALPDVQLHGAVETIANDLVGAGFPITIGVSGARLRPGMHFRAQIEVARVPNVIVVPAAAVTVDGVAYVHVDGRRVPVALGHRAGTQIEITAGLAAGDRVELP